MAYAISPEYRARATPTGRAPLAKLVGRIVEWDRGRGRGFIVFEKHRIPMQRDDFVAHHKRPEVGDHVDFVLGRDEEGRLHALQVEHHNDGGRIRFWNLLVLAPFLAAPGYALWKLSQGIDWKWVAGSVVAMSIIGFMVYWLDKLRARHGQWRVAETTLHLIALLGGWPGAYLAQRHFHHKTKKLRFQLLFWLIVTLHQFIAVDYLRDWTVMRELNADFMRVTMNSGT